MYITIYKINNIKSKPMFPLFRGIGYFIDYKQFIKITNEVRDTVIYCSVFSTKDFK